MNTVNEFIVLYFDDNISAISNKINAISCKKLSKEAERNIYKKVKSSYAFDYPLHDYRAIKIELTNGSAMAILIINKGITTFELQEGFREHFSELLSESNNVSYNLTDLSKKDQRRSILSLSILERLIKWKIPTFGRKKRQRVKVNKIVSGYYSDLEEDELEKLVEKGKILGKMNNMARELCYLPANILDSKSYIEKIEKFVSDNSKIKYELFTLEDLQRKKAGLFCAVSQADQEQGCGIVKLTYKPKLKKKLKKIALVGKGIVYDSGGLDLKTDGSLQGMHRDMTGSAVALATFLAAVKLNLKVEINCFLPITENKISRDAYRTGDIITALNGAAVEITDTDAEGRLVLADSITLAKKGRPNFIMDYATLTGTVIDALGGRMAGVFSNSEKLLNQIVQAGKESGERVGAFPILDEIYREIQESDMADIKQETDDDCAHIIGAAFLKYFAEKTPWIHMDIGCENVDGGLGLVPTDVTGFGVFISINLIEKLIQEK